MALRLPRLQRVVEIVTDSKPTLAFHRWWDSVASAIENQVADLLALIGRVTTTETNIAALTARNLSAGAGLTGGGDLSADRTFNVGAGTGLVVTADAVALADTAVTPGSYGSAGVVATFTVDQQGRMTNAGSVPIAIPSSGVTGANLTKADDTNITVTLGGTPTGALLNAVSLTLGWTGTLSVARGGTNGGTPSGTLLDNITGFAATGQIVRTGAGVYSFRTLTGPAAGITVTNGDGVAGNPTLALANDLAALEALSGTNTIYYRSAADTWTAVTIGTNLSFSAGTLDTASRPSFGTTIGVGGAAGSASGAGISFPATQSDSADPNTLDDYEEGTWSPTVTSLGGTLTSYTASGTYTKIGRMVHASIDVTITNNGTGATALSITLPFTSNSGVVHIATGRARNTSGKMLQGQISASSGVVNVVNYDNTYPASTGEVLTVTAVYQT